MVAMGGMGGPQAVILASDTGSRLYPLNSSECPKSLLPVGNRPLLSYPLAMIEASSVHHVIIVCSGEETADRVHHWIESGYSGDLRIELKVIPQNLGSADALRAVSDSLTASTVAVLSSDIVSDVPLSVVLATHTMRGAAVTTLLHPRRVLPSTETKPGKAPKNVEYIGLDKSQNFVISLAGGADARRTVSLPWSAMRRGPVTLRTDLEEAHVYVFHRAALMAALECKPNYGSLKQEVVPWLVRRQHRILLPPPSDMPDSQASSAKLESTSSGGMDAADSLVGYEGVVGGLDEVAGGGTNPDGGPTRGRYPEATLPHCVTAYLPAAPLFCARANTTQAYVDINKEVATPAVAVRLLGAATNARHENWMDPSTRLGAKATVGAGCIVAPGCIVGDKSTLKRSIVGRGVTIGRDVKVINSVVMEGVAVEEGAHIQGSILCPGVRVEAHASLKDCQVGAGLTIAEGADHRGEALSRSSRAGRGGNAPASDSSSY